MCTVLDGVSLMLFTEGRVAFEHTSLSTLGTGVSANPYHNHRLFTTIIIATAYACPYLGCTKRFTSKSNMKRHHQTHGAATPDTEPVAGSSTGPGTLAQPAPASSSSSSGHFSVLHLGNQPPPPPGAAGQPPSP